jgi:hypothetical protein
MCTWTPTRRTRAAFALAFPYVIGPRNHTFLIGSNEPIPLDHPGWRRRSLEPDLVRYLGAANSADVLTTTSKLAEYGEPEIAEEAPNSDLFPRDEFSAP